MVLARAFVAALAASALSAAAPALAQLGARPIVVYPVASASGASGEAADVTSLLDAALRRLVLRTDEIVLQEPLFIRGTCGSATSAAVPCLAGLAGNGLVIRVTVHRSQSIMVVALEAVDARARSFGPVTVSVDAYAQSSEPLVRAMLVLIEQVNAASRRTDVARGPVPAPPAPAVAGPRPPAGAPARSAVAAEKPAPVAMSPATAAQAPASVAEKPPIAEKPPAPAPGPPPTAKPPPAERPSLAVVPKPPPVAEGRAPIAAAQTASGPAGASGAWMRTAGPILTGAGAAILAGGIAVSVMNHSLSSQLDRKFASGTLTAGDLDQYRKVERSNQLTRILVGAGGALTLGGVAVWTAAPSRGAVAAGVSARF